MNAAERAARIKRIATHLRWAQRRDGAYQHAIGCIQAFIRPSKSDTDIANGVRDVLAALDLVTKGAAEGIPATDNATPDPAPRWYSDSHLPVTPLPDYADFDLDDGTADGAGR